MILHNINITGQPGLSDIRIVNDKIEKIISPGTFLKSDQNELHIEFNEVIAFPGLINSHDHLEFNLFPQLGNKVYKNYMEWGPDIHSQNKNIISGITKIPKQLRADWGVYKNLLNGITTVVHHGNHFNIENPMIDIFQDCHALHSVRLEKYWKFKLNNPFTKNWPFVIHVGEGTDVSAFEEIDKLINWNLFKRRLIAIHGVAMNIQQAKKFEALIWCPGSNFFLLNATAKVEELKKQTNILFGTDSTVSAGWNVWEQIRLARKTNMLTDKELFDSITIMPALAWGLDDKGILADGKKADIVIAKVKANGHSLNSFFQTDPNDILLVLKNGEIILFDETLFSQLRHTITLTAFSSISLDKNVKYVKGNLQNIVNQIKEYGNHIEFPFEIV